MHAKAAFGGQAVFKALVPVFRSAPSKVYLAFPTTEDVRQDVLPIVSTAIRRLRRGVVGRMLIDV